MAAETIREFLVELGFKVDHASYNKFNESIEKSTKTVAGLTLAIEGMALALTYAVLRTAQNFEQLYYSSQRTGASVTQIRALDLAAQSFGTTAGEMQAGLENFAQKMKTDPATMMFAKAQLASVGHTMKFLKDGTVDAGDAIEGFFKYFNSANIPEFLKLSYGQQLGFSYRDILAFQQPGALEAYHKQLGIMGGGRMDELAKKARQVEMEMRELKANFDVIWAQISLGLLKVLLPELEKLAHWIESHQKDIRHWIDASVKAIEEAAPKIEKAAGQILKVAELIIKAWKGVFGVFKDFGQWIEDHLPTSFIDKLGAAVGQLLDLMGLRSQEEITRDQMQQASQDVSPLSEFGRGWWNTQERLHNWWHNDPSFVVRQELLSKYPKSTVAGILANIMGEDASFDRHLVGPGGHMGLFQMGRDEQAAFQKFSGVDVAHSTAMDQLRYVEHWLAQHPDVMKNMLTGSAGQAAYAFATGYERMGNTPQETQRLALERAQRAEGLMAKLDADIHVDVSGTGSNRDIGLAAGNAAGKELGKAVRDARIVAR